ncbi:isoprenylcysteine carboxylmethyltransferase family protein [Labrys neptuniae]|uniref:Isoprenylcysteine carboxylmethyltransferase family protein n=1 Tax=Labrys neptuniae TaxID=376174 RepID=A0ABV3PR79_9HYPH|nr:isoprenylcysteine carboxylmethyltransferase family protein [Labrys neptuniae]MDT3375915.1 isoprenylcysteine carboxylmethyltransferase family protein [Labrys neptuniae]
MIVKLVLQNLVFVGIMGLVLFLSAGTLAWTAAWFYLVVSLAVGLAAGLWLAWTDPDLLAERMRLKAPEQPSADKWFMLVFLVVAVVWFVVIGLERRLRAPTMPLPLEAVGLVLYLASTLFVMWVFRENSFAAPVVKVQAERHHHVVSTGPYAFVRHPMYAGVMLYFIGTPLLIGSWWGLAMMPVFFLAFALRSRIEERTLMTGLPGYADYARSVRYRMLPGIW